MGLPYRDLAPIGSALFTLNDDMPAGFLICNGAELSRETYAELFANIGTKYGDGDGSTTFNLPDARGYFPRFLDDGSGNDPDVGTRTDRGDGTTGDFVGTKQDDDFESHNHTYFLTGVGPGNRAVGGPATLQIVGSTNFRGGNETRGKNIAMRLLIRGF